jgi:pimeloyl-ACP methyl ester carboxylesterase
MISRSSVVSWCLLLPILLVTGCNKAPPAANTDPDPHWVIRQTPPAKVALVYVHGVTGDMVGTWTAPNGQTFWNLVERNDATRGKIDTFVYGFPSYIFKSGSFDVREAANRLHERLEYHQVLSYPAVVFVAHSMGGLVVLRELLTHREVLAKVPVVMFYATPMEGSLIAAIGKEFSPNSALSQMTEADGNALLQTLNDEWRSIPDDKRPHVRCAYENKPLGPMKIVPWSSATRFCEGATPAIEATHSSIVKPDRPGADAIIYLANALNTYVLGKSLEAKLETPDFMTEGAETVFTLTNVLGKQTARLLNEGGSPLRFMFAEISDPSLFLWPDDTPREIPAHDRADISIALARGATKTQYQFTLRTPIQPDKRISVRVPDLAALNTQQTDVARKVGERIKAALSDPQQIKLLQQAPPQEAPAAIVQMVRDEVARESPQLPESAQWVLTADLLHSLNWPTLAARALHNAQQASPAVVHLPGVQLLGERVAAQSGAQPVFATSEAPGPTATALETWKVAQPLTSPATAALGAEVAQRMQQIPALKVFGLSLEGDVEQAKGNLGGARKAFRAAAAIRPSPSVVARLTHVEATAVAK